jgi:ATP-binding cassette subfamily F protein 3
MPSDCSELSGGQVSRLLLAKALLRPAELLLLDEPTNHLDLGGILWLTRFLQDYCGAFLVVSHDRHFLDSVTEHTWEIESLCLSAYPCGFSKSRLIRKQQDELRAKEYDKQQEWKSRTEEYIRRNMAGQKTKQAQSRQRALEKVEWLERPSGSVVAPSISIRSISRGGAFSFWMKDLTIGYGTEPVVSGINLRAGRGDRIAVLGGNGSGKSTLLKTLLGELGVMGGKAEWGFGAEPSYFPQNPTFPNLDDSVLAVLRREDRLSTDLALRSFAASFLFKGEDVFKTVGQLSGGERSRLALARQLMHPANILVLDEPTNHLDIPGREALEEALVGFDGTILVVSHDLYFVERVAGDYYFMEDGRLRQVDSVAALETPRAERQRTAATPEARTRRSERNGKALSKNERRRREIRLAETEARIHTLEDEQKETEVALGSDLDHVTVAALAGRHEEIGAELEELYAGWEQLSSELAEN